MVSIGGLMKKIEHWAWMVKQKTNISKRKVTGDKKLAAEIELLEDEICSLKKEIVALKKSAQEKRDVWTGYSIPFPDYTYVPGTIGTITPGPTVNGQTTDGQFGRAMYNAEPLFRIEPTRR